MLNNNAAYKYEMPFNGTFVITWCWTSGTVTLQYGAIKIRYSIRRIKPNKYDANIQYITTK